MRSRARDARVVGALAVVALAAFEACVGDDPTPTASTDGGDLSDGSSAAVDGSSDDSTTADGSSGPCNVDAPFGTPLLVPGLESAGEDATPALTSDELEIYFTRTPAQGGFTGADIYHARRPSRRAAFEQPAPFFDRPNQFDSDPFVWSDGETIFAALMGMNGSLGSADLYLLTKDGGATAVTGVNTANFEGNPFLTADGKELWYVRELPSTLLDGGASKQIDIFRAHYDKGAATGETSVGELNLESARDEWPVLTADKKTVFFASTRTDGVSPGTGQNVWVAHRAKDDTPFDPPAPVSELNSPSDDAPRWLSPDGCRLYLRSDRGGSKSIYMAERPR